MAYSDYPWDYLDGGGGYYDDPSDPYGLNGLSPTDPHTGLNPFYGGYGGFGSDPGYSGPGGNLTFGATGTGYFDSTPTGGSIWGPVSQPNGGGSGGGGSVSGPVSSPQNPQVPGSSTTNNTNNTQNNSLSNNVGVVSATQNVPPPISSGLPQSNNPYFTPIDSAPAERQTPVPYDSNPGTGEMTEPPVTGTPQVKKPGIMHGLGNLAMEVSGVNKYRKMMQDAKNHDFGSLGKALNTPNALQNKQMPSAPAITSSVPQAQSPYFSPIELQRKKRQQFV